MNIYFTADTHFGHENIIDYCNRPFTCARDMQAFMINAWNNVVGHNDRVYHLGDFGFLNHSTFEHILSKLNGEVYLIRGNHDQDYVEKVVDHTFRYHEFKFSSFHQYRNSTLEVALFHYPIERWHHMKRDMIHLHGHVHGNMGVVTAPNRIDVGVDNWEYAPVSVEQIKNVL